MIDTRVATDPEMQAWLSEWRARLLTWYARLDVPANWASAQVDGRMDGFRSARGSVLEALTDSGELIGLLAVHALEQGGQHSAFLSDIWVAPAYRGRGYGRLALRRAEDDGRRILRLARRGRARLRGYGRAAMIIGERATLDAGDTYLALNVFGQNQVAINLYNSMGYRAYDVGRSVEL